MKYIVIVERNVDKSIARIVIPALSLQFKHDHLTFDPQSNDIDDVTLFCQAQAPKILNRQKKPNLRLISLTSEKDIEKKCPKLGKGPADLWEEVEINYVPPKGFFEKFLPYYGPAASFIDHVSDALQMGLMLAFNESKALSIFSMINGIPPKFVKIVVLAYEGYFQRTGKLIDDLIAATLDKISKGFGKLRNYLFPCAELQSPTLVNEVFNENAYLPEEIKLTKFLSTSSFLSKALTIGMFGYDMYSSTQAKFNQFAVTDQTIRENPDDTLVSAQVYSYLSWGNIISGLASDPFENIAYLMLLCALWTTLYEKLSERFSKDEIISVVADEENQVAEEKPSKNNTTFLNRRDSGPKTELDERLLSPAEQTEALNPSPSFGTSINCQT